MLSWVLKFMLVLYLLYCVVQTKHCEQLVCCLFQIFSSLLLLTENLVLPNWVFIYEWFYFCSFFWMFLNNFMLKCDFYHILKAIVVMVLWVYCISFVFDPFSRIYVWSTTSEAYLMYDPPHPRLILCMIHHIRGLSYVWSTTSEAYLMYDPPHLRLIL